MSDASSRGVGFVRRLRPLAKAAMSGIGSLAEIESEVEEFNLPVRSRHELGSPAIPPQKCIRVLSNSRRKGDIH